MLIARAGVSGVRSAPLGERNVSLFRTRDATVREARVDALVSTVFRGGGFLPRPPPAAGIDPDRGAVMASREAMRRGIGGA
jgi:hypothetical protein